MKAWITIKGGVGGIWVSCGFISRLAACLVSDYVYVERAMPVPREALRATCTSSFKCQPIHASDEMA